MRLCRFLLNGTIYRGTARFGEAKESLKNNRKTHTSNFKPSKHKLSYLFFIRRLTLMKSLRNERENIGQGGSPISPCMSSVADPEFMGNFFFAKFDVHQTIAFI